VLKSGDRVGDVYTIWFTSNLQKFIIYGTYHRNDEPQGRRRLWGHTTKKIHLKTSQDSLHNDMAVLVR